MDFSKIDKEIQKYWEDQKVFAAEDQSKKPKYYCLDMFPYPSGEGLHVGHVKGYTASDIISRYKMMKGYNVLHPMGWDAFGLPAENYALKVGKRPQETVKENIDKFKKQLKELGYGYDWSREINTTDPDYYKWTQWIFLKIYKKGLAYQSNEPINFCPSCKTGLANEEVVGGLCERCGTKVEKKRVRQWVLKITAYADRLLNDLDKLDWPEPILEMQRNWIGKSTGSIIKFKIKDEKYFLDVFTTRADTLYGATYMVVAPEHEIISNLKSQISNWGEVEKYIETAANKSDLERAELQREKTGVEIKGLKAINPANNKEIPIWVADYVLAHYGTGAVMAVPAHDQRDFEFAKKYNLPIVQSVAPVFIIRDGADAVREDKKTVERDTVLGVVKHWSEDKYYCLDWKNFGWKSLVIGGIDEGESPEEAVIREVKEETGYQDIKKITKIGIKTHAKFFAKHKDENRYGRYDTFLVELKSGEYRQPDPVHTQNHQGLWMEKSKVSDFLNLKNNKFVWDMFVSNGENFEEYGVLFESGEFNGLDSKSAIKKITDKLRSDGAGDFAVSYKLRDWIFSRQRYWGEPIPLVHCQKCGVVPVPESELPVELPEIEKYEPTGTGESPLVNVKDWVSTKCPKCGGAAERETNTMPQWAGSCWYYLRYLDPQNSKALCEASQEKYFMPVDLYIGGAEHAVLHLLYARFWHKVLYDEKIVSTDEPFKKLQNVGLILATDRQKMSKSRGNIVNPSDIVLKNGVDAFRMYEMFIGPFSQPAVWAPTGVTGTKKFLDKVSVAFEGRKKANRGKVERKLADLSSRISDKIEKMHFNTAISDFMKFIAEVELEELSDKEWTIFLQILAPFAPHFSEYCWKKLGEEGSIFNSSWPKGQFAQPDLVDFVVQINGKKSGLIAAAPELGEKELVGLVARDQKIGFNPAQAKKVVFVKGRLVNFVV